MGSLLPCRQKVYLEVFFFVFFLLTYLFFQSFNQQVYFWKHRLQRFHSVETSQHFIQVNFIKTLHGLHIFQNRMVPASILHSGGQTNNLNTFSFKITHCQKTWGSGEWTCMVVIGKQMHRCCACDYSHSVEPSAGHPYLSVWSGLFCILIVIRSYILLNVH